MTTDPLDALRLPATPIAPPSEFAARLRARVEAALLGPDPEADPDHEPTADARPDHRSTAMTTTQITTTRITPYLIVAGAAEAIDFYREAFGLVETFRLDMPDGRVGHAELGGGGAEIALADEYPEHGIVGPASLGGTTVTLQLVVPDVDAVVAAAVAAGASLEREVADQFHGNRSGTVIDPFGHRWSVQTPIEEVSIEEMRRRLAELDD